MTSLGEQLKDVVVQTKAERCENDTLQVRQTMISNLRRWLLGTQGGAVHGKHLQFYLDKFAFCHNWRKTNYVGRLAGRVIEQLVTRLPLTV